MTKDSGHIIVSNLTVVLRWNYVDENMLISHKTR